MLQKAYMCNVLEKGQGMQKIAGKAITLAPRIIFVDEEYVYAEVGRAVYRLNASIAEKIYESPGFFAYSTIHDNVLYISASQ